MNKQDQKKILRRGQKVRIKFRADDETIPAEMCRFNGKEAIISKRYKRTSDGNYNWYFYELQGVNSRKGIPFTFVREYLMPVTYSK